MLRVVRKGGQAVHYLDGPLSEGSSVVQQLAWFRRNDHMQQHSAQHLITGFVSPSSQFFSFAGIASNVNKT